MKTPTCSQFRAQLQEIKELKAEFDLELPKIKDTRNTALALGLENEIREKMGLVKEGLHDFFSEQKMKEAEHIMQKDFLGPEAIEKTFSFKPEIKDIPLIPFSKAELERVKELGQFLILRVDKTPDGRPLTMKKMNELKGGKTSDGGKILYRNDNTGKIKSDTWHKDEAFFTAETPSLGWALVSKEVIPNSTDKNYLEQTEIIANYLKTKVCKDQVMSEEYKGAINEFKQAKEGIKELMSSDWQAAAKKLALLKINQLFRQTSSEVLYDMLLRKEKIGEYLLSHHWTWTKSRASGGDLVLVGAFDLGGVFVNRNTPDYSLSHLGVAFSRRL